MIIQIDTREKARAIKKIVETFDSEGVRHYTSKLYVGDYMNLNNPKIIVDRKQNLLELCGNVCQQHERFRKELLRAQENEIQLIILVEHGDPIYSIEDVRYWQNPRKKKRIKKDGVWQDTETKAMGGNVLYKILKTMESKYGVRFEFCDKDETGHRIMELLNENS